MSWSVVSVATLVQLYKDLAGGKTVAELSTSTASTRPGGGDHSSLSPVNCETQTEPDRLWHIDGLCVGLRSPADKTRRLSTRSWDLPRLV